MNRLRLMLIGLLAPVATTAQIKPSLDSSALYIQAGHKEYLSHCFQRVNGESFLWLQFAQQELVSDPRSTANPFAHAPESLNLPLYWAIWPQEKRLQTLGPWVYATSQELEQPVPTSWTGTTLSTTDARAVISLRLTDHPVREHVHLWISQPKTSFQVALVSGQDTQWLKPSASTDEPLLWLEFPRAVSLHNAQLMFRSTESNQTHFTVHALLTSSETSNDGYWVYAGQPNLSMQSIERQLRQSIPYNSRLVVLELGAKELRDYSGSPIALNQWKSNAQRLIVEIKRQVPEADIVLVSPMAQLRGGQPNPLAQTWSYTLRELAEELDCGYFDWFRISGGLWAMQDWINAGWARYDGQWLSPEGQKIWSQCWWQAWNQSQLAPGPELWVSDQPSYQATPPPVQPLDIVPEAEPISQPVTTEPFLPSFHTVSPGETLYSISKRYNCSVSQLQAINGMGQSTQIRIGQKLRVPRP